MLRHSPHSLRQLAGLYGVQTAYCNTMRRRQHTEPETPLTVWRLLGVPITTYMEALQHMPHILAILHTMNHIRKQGINAV
jgi:hypothetical protein